MEGLKGALASERSEKARLDMARENLQADVAAMRANLQQLSRELAYRRSAPDEALSGQLNQQEVECAPKVHDRAVCMCISQLTRSSSIGPSLVEEKLATMCTRTSPAEKKHVLGREYSCTCMPELASVSALSMALTEAPRHVQSEDARKTIALMDAKIRRLQGIILRSQPQEELNLRTIQSLEQVRLLKQTRRGLLEGLVSAAIKRKKPAKLLSIEHACMTHRQRLLPCRTC